MGWAPNDKYLWDTWFAHDRDGVLHAFFLQADKAACNFIPFNRHDMAEVGHAVLTADAWKYIDGKPCLAARAGSWDNISIWTGSVIYDRQSDSFYMFYTSRDGNSDKKWTPRGEFVPQQIGVATSRDLITWERIDAILPNCSAAMGLDGVNWRDPYVIEYGGKYICLLSAHANPKDGISENAGGAIVFFESESLTDWSQASPRVLVLSPEFYQLEVPQLYRHVEDEGVRFFLLFCAQAADCTADRKSNYPEDCATGTYYFASELYPHDSSVFPSFDETPRLLAPDIYAGKIIDVDGIPSLIGFDYQGGETDFVGGLSEATPVTFPDNKLKLLQR